MFGYFCRITFTLIFFLSCQFLSAQDFSVKTGALNTEFALKVLREISENNEENFNFAPLNLSLTLSLAANGASGETRSEMMNVLGYKGHSIIEVNSYQKALRKVLAQQLDDIELELAQSMWIDQHLKVEDEFKRINSFIYNADLKELDLDDPLAPDHINSWVFEQTDGKIFSLVDDISEDIIMYLLSSFYFQGKWGVQFNQDNSSMMEFQTRDSGAREQMFMKTKSKKISWLDEKDFKP